MRILFDQGTPVPLRNHLPRSVQEFERPTGQSASRLLDDAQRLVSFGPSSLQHAVRQFVAPYHTERTERFELPASWFLVRSQVLPLMRNRVRNASASEPAR